MDKKNETATLGGGCFWCIEAVFQQIKGVSSVKSGYSGGRWPDPSYREVSFGRSGHAEVVQVEFDPEIISFEDLLRIFFSTHDPTTPNQQGNDKGHQYRSVIFFHDEEQRLESEKVMEEMKVWFEAPIVTELTAYKAFYLAEDYHQNFFTDNQEHPYCQAIIPPKLKKLRELHADKLH
ncbi:MAG: peptide-methionine (S)-S-oxide reductase MsrA [Bacteroidia bacterium]|nr:peptide-methionine (S)-S-oxide reductase MsrA [Bacteroidia bacterium]